MKILAIVLFLLSFPCLAMEPIVNGWNPLTPTEKELIHAHCDNLNKEEIIQFLNGNVYLTDHNAKVLDLSIRFEENGACYGDVITDRAGQLRIYFEFVSDHGKGYISMEIKRV